MYSLYPSHTPIEQTLFTVIMGVKTAKYGRKAFTLNAQKKKKKKSSDEYVNCMLKFVNKKETFVHICECESEGNLSSVIHNYNRRKTKVVFVFFNFFLA